MKGLMRKDWYILKNYRQNALIILVVGVGLAVFQKGGPIMVPSFCMFICCTYIMGLFTYDDAVDWERYQASLPCNSRQVVASRYAVSYTLLGGVCVASYLLALVILLAKGITKGVDLEGIVALSAATAIILLICTLVMAVLLPLCYKLGVEKVRYVIFVVYGAVIAILVLVILLAGDALDNAIGRLGTFAVLGGGLAALALAMAGLAFLSYHVSTRIYAKKEF